MGGRVLDLVHEHIDHLPSLDELVEDCLTCFILPVGLVERVLFRLDFHDFPLVVGDEEAKEQQLSQFSYQSMKCLA